MPSCCGACAHGLSKRRVSLFLFCALPPLVATIHDINHVALESKARPLHRLYYRLLLAPRLRSARAVVTVSQFSKDQIAGYFGLPESRICLAYNGIGTEFAPQPPETIARVRFPVPFARGLHSWGRQRQASQEPPWPGGCLLGPGPVSMGPRAPVFSRCPASRLGQSSRKTRPPPFSSLCGTRRPPWGVLRRSVVCLSLSLRRVWAASPGGLGLRHPGPCLPGKLPP